MFGCLRCVFAFCVLIVYLFELVSVCAVCVCFCVREIVFACLRFVLKCVLFVCFFCVREFVCACFCGVVCVLLFVFLFFSFVVCL